MQVSSFSSVLINRFHCINDIVTDIQSQIDYLPMTVLSIKLFIPMEIMKFYKTCMNTLTECADRWKMMFNVSKYSSYNANK